MLTVKKKRKQIASMILCLLMAIAMVVPAAIPCDVYAAEETAASVAVESTEQTETVAEVPASTRFTISGYDITFKQKVMTEEFLGSSQFTDTLKTTGKKKSIKLTWKSVKDKSGITGYIIVRKDLTSSRYRQIAMVGRNTTSYTDKKAKKKNKCYYYMLLPYTKVNGVVKVAKPSQWAGSVTTKSKKKNVDKSRLLRAAKGSAVRVGGTTQVAAKFNKKAYSKRIRWSSSNTKVAKINKKGVITGISEGKATIYGRTHTGYVFKFKVTVVEGGTAESMINVMKSWMGYSYYNQKNRGIVDIYNSVYPLPNGYAMGYYDAWCDCTVSAAAIVSGNEDKIGRNCSVPRHVKIFKSMGIWIEGCKTVPQPGDLIVFNWYPSKKNNASHIGIVEAVDGNTITTIEGNMGIGKVGSRTITVGWKYIRGYARPNYKLDGDSESEEADETGTETDSSAASETSQGA